MPKINLNIYGDFAKRIKTYAPKKEMDSRQESKGTYISSEEIACIIRATPNLRMRLFILLSYHFGFRIGELTNLKKANVIKRDGRVYVRLEHSDTKTRKSRTVPLNEILGARLEAWIKTVAGPFVFPSKGNKNRPVSKQAIDRAWANTLVKAEIDRRIRFHDLRHTCATNFANREVNETKACAILGMSPKIYFSTYVKRSNLKLESIIDSISFEGISND